MTATLDRLALTQSRLSEYFSAKELAMQIGGDVDAWPLILIKELIDNSLDACEANGPPIIQVTIDQDGFTVTDNGPGLPDEVLVGSLDYSQRISTKAAYVSPTRGRLGNALKVLWAAPYVAHGAERTTITVDTPSARHIIRVRYDAIRQEPTLEHFPGPATVKIGTSVSVPYPQLARLLDGGKWREFYGLLAAFAVGNPHATFTWRIMEEEGAFAATCPTWRKWSVTKPTPVSWYTPDQFANYLAAFLANGHHALTLRQFIGQFAGLSGTQKQKAVADTAVVGNVLGDLVRNDQIDSAASHRLYRAMVDASASPQPKALGLIGREHLEASIRARFDLMDDSFVYRKAEYLLATDGAHKPVIIEVAFGVLLDADDLQRFELVNWSVPLGSPLGPLLGRILQRASIDDADPVALIIAVSMADARFSDHGKARLELPLVIGNQVAELVVTATKRWARFKAKIRREVRGDARRFEKAVAAAKRPQLTATEACESPGVMLDAYLKASGNGHFPANARQIMYAARPVVIERMGKAVPWKNDATFTQIILPNYLTNHPEETAGWDVVYDDRGHFDEPFTGIGIGLGTVAVRNYIRRWSANEPRDTLAAIWQKDELVATTGPANRYRYALFIEKEGFSSLLNRAKFAERFDLAIFSTKGMSVTAARELVEALAKDGVTILALHDLDKSGIKIRHTLGNDTRRYAFQVRPVVIDIGLRLEDIAALGLEAEPVTYQSNRHPREDILASGGTDEDAEFLVDGGSAGNWTGRRTELNAMTSDVFVAWLDRRLQEIGVEKVIPEEPVLVKAFVRARRLQRLEDQMADIISAINAVEISAPTDLLARVRSCLANAPELSWDGAITALVEAGNDDEMGVAA